MQIATFAIGTDARVVARYGLVEAALRAGTLGAVPMTGAAFGARDGFIWLHHRSRSPALLAYMEAVREEERAFAKQEAELDAWYRPRTRRRARP